MSQRWYRPAVVITTLVWFLLGLHAPSMVHQFAHHGRVPDATVLVLVAALAVAGVACLVALLRAPRFGGAGGTSPHD